MNKGRVNPWSQCHHFSLNAARGLHGKHQEGGRGGNVTRIELRACGSARIRLQSEREGIARIAESDRDGAQTSRGRELRNGRTKRGIGEGMGRPTRHGSGGASSEVKRTRESRRRGKKSVRYKVVQTW